MINCTVLELRTSLHQKTPLRVTIQSTKWEARFIHITGKNFRDQKSLDSNRPSS